MGEENGLQDHTTSSIAQVMLSYSRNKVHTGKNLIFDKFGGKYTGVHHIAFFHTLFYKFLINKTKNSKEISIRYTLSISYIQ